MFPTLFPYKILIFFFIFHHYLAAFFFFTSFHFNIWLLFILFIIFCFISYLFCKIIFHFYDGIKIHRSIVKRFFLRFFICLSDVRCSETLTNETNGTELLRPNTFKANKINKHSFLHISHFHTVFLNNISSKLKNSIQMLTDKLI